MSGRPPLSIDELKDKRVTVRLNNRQAEKLERITQHYSFGESTLMRIALQHFFDNSEQILGKIKPKDSS